jgi:Flp pilus assembly protein TadD
LGDFERAAQAFQRGLELAPTDARMHAALAGAIASVHGLNKSAEAELHRAAELDPNSPELFVDLALVYQRFGRTAEAFRLFKRAILLDPTNPIALEALNDRGQATDDPGRGFFKRLFNKK